jgi:serine/threonine protein kinase
MSSSWQRTNFGNSVVRFDRNGDQLYAPSQIADRYEIDDVLSAEGGFGVIYIAHDNRLFDRKVLIKARRYPATIFSNQEDSSRIEQIRILRKQIAFELNCLLHFRHQRENRVPSVHDYCYGYAPSLVGPHTDIEEREWFLDPQLPENAEIITGEPYIVLQWVAGETASAYRERCSQERNWEVTVLKLGRELATILARLHEPSGEYNRYFIYQDLKPSNIIVSHGGFFTLVDFGGLTVVMNDQDGIPCSMCGYGTPGTGTWGFKAPEMHPERGQLRRLDHRVDVYALGATLFYLLTGLDPATQKEFGPLALEQLKTRSPLTAEIITRAVSEDKDARFSGMSEMRQEFMNALRDIRKRA